MSTITGDSLLQQLNWRYATKAFDPTKQIPSGEWAALEQACIASEVRSMPLGLHTHILNGGSNISGGVAQADVLGILGRQGVFSANEWNLGGGEPFIAAAFNMFRNYDAHNSTFGDTSIGASNDDAADTSVYASIDSSNPNHMVLIVINKTGQVVASHLALSHFNFHGLANVYQLTSASANPVAAGTLSVTDPTNFVYNMPAYSVSTLSFTMVPEPASLGLLTVGATMLLRRRRRA